MRLNVFFFCSFISSEVGPYNTSSYCNVFDLMMGVVFYPTLAYEPILELLTVHSPLKIASLAYDASVKSLYGNYYHDEREYDFCTLSYGSCSLMMFDFFDENFRIVSGNHHIVDYPACTDTFSVDQETW